MSTKYEREGLAGTIRGITNNGKLETGLSPIRSTGVAVIATAGK